jgi:hypothetical protein
MDEKHCCSIISGIAKTFLVLAFIAFIAGLIQQSATHEAANKANEKALVEYAKQLGLAKDIWDKFSCINNQVHYETGKSIAGPVYSLHQPIIACDVSHYRKITSNEGSSWILVIAAILGAIGTFAGVMRFQIDDDLQKHKREKQAKA